MSKNKLIAFKVLKEMPYLKVNDVVTIIGKNIYISANIKKIKKDKIIRHTIQMSIKMCLENPEFFEPLYEEKK